MTLSAHAVQVQKQPLFERNVGRAIVAGAAAGAALGVAAAGGFAVRQPHWVAMIALVAAALAAIRAAGLAEKLRDAAIALAIPVAVLAFPMPRSWELGFAAAAIGMLWVRWSSRPTASEAGARRVSWVNYALGAGGTAALALAGVQVAFTLASHLQRAAAPAPVVYAVMGAICALFVALGQAASMVALSPDPVLSRCDELLGRVSGELRSLVLRAVHLYGECASSLQQLPREPAREDLARVLGKVTVQSAEVAAEWAGVENHLQARVRKELHDQVVDLEKTIAESTDAVARAQLEGALDSLRTEERRLDELGNRRQRVIAKLKSQLALLEQARISLLGMQVGSAQLHAAELSALATRMETLAQRANAEADVADTIATSVAIESARITAN